MVLFKDVQSGQNLAPLWFLDSISVNPEDPRRAMIVVTRIYCLVIGNEEENIKGLLRVNEGKISQSQIFLSIRLEEEGGN